MKHLNDSPAALPARVIWRREFIRRICTLWFVKMLATTLSITAFLTVYFWVLHNPLFEVTIMPLTALDRALDYRPEALPLYLSLWFYISIAPALLAEPREITSYGVYTFLLSVVGLGIFIFWPTAVPKFDIDWSQHPSMSFLKDIDLAANACPSMHVAFAVFTAIWLERLLREMNTGPALRTLNWLWCLGILYSTIATRQHVALDVLAGALLGSVVAALHLRSLRVNEPGEVLIPAGDVNTIGRPQQ